MAVTEADGTAAAAQELAGVEFGDTAAAGTAASTGQWRTRWTRRQARS